MGTRTRLAAMMGLVYAVQGAWWPVLSLHLADLGVTSRGRGWIFATMAISALLTPGIAGRIADRRVPAQRLLALIYAIGTVLLAAAALGLVTTFAGLFPLFLTYWLLTVPYLGLINTIAMRNLERPREEFGAIRLWGTVGWMMAGWLVSGVMALRGTGHGSHEAFWIASALSAVLAVFALSLPNTPPLAIGSRGMPWRETMAFVRSPGVAVLLATGFAVSLTTPFVYQAVPAYLLDAGLPREQVATAMTLGQVPEILSLGVLPLVLRRLGRRNTMALGITAWLAYHSLFASRPPVPVALFAVSLNGVAIAFFHVVAPMYLDTQAPPDHRAGAQSLWVMVTSGLGSLAGGLFAGEVMQRSGGDWQFVFATPAFIAGSLLVAFLIAFRSGGERRAPAGASRLAMALSPEPGER